MHRYFVTGTDTDIGKTRAAAALALALRDANPAKPPTVIKLVQTGLKTGVPGDAARAGKLAGVPYLELARFEKAADPFSAALAQGAPEVRARELADALASVEGPLVAEGAGGIMVPLNVREHFGHVAVLAKLSTIIVVGLRLGCLNHALLTLTLCRQCEIPVAGAVLVDRFGPSKPDYLDDVVRALQGKLDILGILPFATDEAASVQAGSQLFSALT
ncbi:MAG: dethiobiotin synthase [Vulcanimicrobiaceae bacterium]